MPDIVRKGQHPNLHRSVEVGNLIWLCGLAADDNSLPMFEQTMQIAGKIDAALAECGSDKTRIVSATIYIADFKLKEEMNRAWKTWLEAKDLPARMTLAADIGGPLVEIVVTAVKK